MSTGGVPEIQRSNLVPCVIQVRVYLVFPTQARLLKELELEVKLNILTSYQLTTQPYQWFHEPLSEFPFPLMTYIGPLSSEGLFGDWLFLIWFCLVWLIVESLRDRQYFGIRLASITLPRSTDQSTWSVVFSWSSWWWCKTYISYWIPSCWTSISMFLKPQASWSCIVSMMLLYVSSYTNPNSCRKFEFFFFSFFLFQIKFIDRRK